MENAENNQGQAFTEIFDTARAKAAQAVDAPPFEKIREEVEKLSPGAGSNILINVINACRLAGLNDFDKKQIYKIAAKHAASSLGAIQELESDILRQEAGRMRTIRPGEPGIDIAELKGKDLWDFLGLDQAENGNAALDNMNNAEIVLSADTRIKDHIWFDDFAKRITTKLVFGNGGITYGEDREWTDNDDREIALHMQRNIGLPHMRVETVFNAVRVVANRRKVNPPMDWMESLEWDGIERLPDAMTRIFGADNNDYHAQVGRCFFISIVARVYRPGCKVDTVPVFEGGQGLGKSQAIQIIGGKWGSECHAEVTSKDFYQVLDGNMLVEIAEMHAFSRAEVNRIKGVISCPVDRYRAPYERHAADHPRRTVLAGTTNRSDWNTDETGARRFWPVLCTYVDHAWLRENRDQLFAEAVARFKRGEDWWSVPKEEAARRQEERRPEDVWADKVRAYVDQGHGINANWVYMTAPANEVKISNILADAIGLSTAEQDKRAEARVAAILTALGWERDMRGPKTARYRCWIRQSEHAKFDFADASHDVDDGGRTEYQPGD